MSAHSPAATCTCAGAMLSHVSPVLRCFEDNSKVLDPHLPAPLMRRMGTGPPAPHPPPCH